MKVLVTGAAGFIGSHLCERLKSLGHAVIGIDNFNPHYCQKLKMLNAADLTAVGVTVAKADLVESDLIPLVDGAEVVFHLAAQPGISATTPFDDYLRNNIVATHKLLEALKNLPTLKLYVNVATSSIYGDPAVGDETTEPKPTSYYGVTKLAAEQLALARFRDKGFPACSARLFSVYGERERPEKLYPKLIDALLNDKPSPLREGSEGHVRSYTYVDDIVDGLVLVMQNPDKVLGEIFNLGAEETITTGEGVAIIEELLGKKAERGKQQKVSGDQKETRANIAKAKRVLGYNPSTTPSEGLRREVAWFKEKIWKKIDLYQ